MSGVSRAIDRVEVTFDDPNLVANAGLLVVAALASRLGLEQLINRTVRLVGRIGGARPGRKVLTVVHTIVAGGSHIDHADLLRAGATQRVLPFRVMAPSTSGTFLRAFTFGHVRPLDAVIAESLRRARVRRAGATGELVCRFDSGFWSGDTIATLGRLGVGYTMAVRTNTKGIAAAIAAIDEAAWVDIDYTPDGQAQVAECRYQGRRLVVRRTRLTDTTQAALWPDWRHHAFLTDLDDDTATLDKFHRHHAVVELAIRDLKEGAGLEHVPSSVRRPLWFTMRAGSARIDLDDQLHRRSARLLSVSRSRCSSR